MTQRGVSLADEKQPVPVRTFSRSCLRPAPTELDGLSVSPTVRSSHGPIHRVASARRLWPATFPFTDSPRPDIGDPVAAPLAVQVAFETAKLPPRALQVSFALPVASVTRRPRASVAATRQHLTTAVIPAGRLAPAGREVE